MQRYSVLAKLLFCQHESWPTQWGKGNTEGSLFLFSYTSPWLRLIVFLKCEEKRLENRWEDSKNRSLAKKIKEKSGNISTACYKHMDMEIATSTTNYVGNSHPLIKFAGRAEGSFGPLAR